MKELVKPMSGSTWKQDRAT